MEQDFAGVKYILLNLCIEGLFYNKELELHRHEEFKFSQNTVKTKTITQILENLKIQL